MAINLKNSVFLGFTTLQMGASPCVLLRSLSLSFTLSLLRNWGYGRGSTKAGSAACRPARQLGAYWLAAVAMCRRAHIAVFRRSPNCARPQTFGFPQKHEGNSTREGLRMLFVFLRPLFFPNYCERLFDFIPSPHPHPHPPTLLLPSPLPSALPLCPPPLLSRSAFPPSARWVLLVPLLLWLSPSVPTLSLRSWSHLPAGSPWCLLCPRPPFMVLALALWCLYSYGLLLCPRRLSMVLASPLAESLVLSPVPAFSIWSWSPIAGSPSASTSMALPSLPALSPWSWASPGLYSSWRSPSVPALSLYGPGLPPLMGPPGASTPMALLLCPCPLWSWSPPSLLLLWLSPSVSALSL